MNTTGYLMNKQHSFLAIIPARGGSKRLPRKNSLALCGKPLITWSIEAAKLSQYLDTIVISSDDDRILDIAKASKVEILKRPLELAQDTSSTVDTIKHVLQYHPNYDYIVLLQPTSPLRTSRHIDQAIEFLEQKNADAIISVSPTQHSPLWCNTLPDDKNMSHFLNDELKTKRSQDLPTYYQLNGAIYICKTSSLLKENSLFLKENIFAFIMDKKSSIDIDDELDFLFAQAILEQDLS